MSTYLAAFIAAMLATGITSAVSHELTLLGACAGALLLTVLTLLNPRVQVYPLLLLLPIAMCIICLVSSEVNFAEESSTIHILACYATLLAFAVVTPDYSLFFRSFILQTNVILTVWILIQASQVTALGAWKITGVASAGNLMAAEINMTLPLVITYFLRTRGLSRLGFGVLAASGALAVFCVMSRNGVGSLLIIILLYTMFNQKKLAILSVTSISLVLAFLDEILAHPVVSQILTRMRILGFKADVSRLTIWDVSVASIRHNPLLGVGPGKQKQILAVLEIDHSHNAIIQVALECGIPAAIVFVTVLVILLKIPADMLFRRREMFVLSLPIISYSVFSITSCPLHYPQMTLLLAACLNEARVASRISLPVAGRTTVPSMATSARTAPAPRKERLPVAHGVLR